MEIKLLMEGLELLFDSVPDVLSQLIRTAFIAKPGHTFLVSDYAAIEARVIAYLAGEQWRLDVFAQGGDIYCASASQMFGVPVVKHGVNGHLRQKGKVAELALGYGGSAGALINMGALKMGLKEEELPACAAKAADGSVVEWGRWPYEVTEEMFVEAILEADKRGKEFLAAL